MAKAAPPPAVGCGRVDNQPPWTPDHHAPHLVIPGRLHRCAPRVDNNEAPRPNGAGDAHTWGSYTVQLNTKTTLFSAIMATSMLVVLIAVSLFSFRQFSLISAEAHTRTAAEIVRVHLTESMVAGTISRRESFLNRLADVQDLLSARVVRGPEVAAQFGGGLKQEALHDSIEQEVLQSGRPYFNLVDETSEPTFRATIPFIAESRGDPNCVSCHTVPVGTVLGAVTLTMSMSHLKETALLTVATMALVIGIFSLISVLFLRRLTRPLSRTAGEVREAVAAALEGNFDSRIERHTNDEVGEIADRFNQLTAHLREGLGKISHQVAQLIRWTPPSGHTNQLVHTIEMVGGLIEAAHFKQSIEEDETKREVYCRLARVIREEFNIERFSLYEVAASKNRITPVVVDAEPQENCRWCSPQILVRADACRAKRTGHVIDGAETPQICNSFEPSGEESLTHICLPVLQSGSVGSVVQLVFPQTEREQMATLVPFIQIYLREAAPVLEAKRLMDTLRESTLRDPMTGLHNRRFLEEYVETLVASVHRRKSVVSILMVDVDFFKKVNDTYGHDAGDSVLKAVAKTLRQTVRASDMVIRYGGEEFMVICLDAVENAGDQVAEKLRTAVEQTKVQLPGATLQKTVSVGIADFPTDSETFWQAVKFADVALYRAKESGRNRVVHFATEMWQDEQNY